ncbi:MAG: histone deacetylase [candidate division WOR-3 bacterium]|nr:histone deacetylase [candidate division WOR-3 bacterium]
MKFIYSDKYEVNIGAHVFATQKYRLIKERLIRENLAKEPDFIYPRPAKIEDVALVHTKVYIDDMLNLRWTSRTVRSELPLTSEIIEAYFIHAQGTILACQEALKTGIGLHLGGGFHHAFADHGEGFCYINDIAVGIKKMQELKLIKRAAVIDCDLHQGNGTARIFQNDDSVFTFSIHQENLYPIKEKSDWDIGLDNGTTDKEYLEKLQPAVQEILSQHKPELVIYVAGADPFFMDQLGALRLTKIGLIKRDEIVIKSCWERKIPVAVTLAGGYAFDINDTVDIHFNTCKVCLAVAKQKIIEITVK